MTIFKNCGDYWKKTTTKEKRPLSTVVTSETQKQELVDDVKEFLYPQTQAWYAERGIPYRRGFLLYGPPGTGKSSLVSAVAGEFDLDIRAVSIPSVDDKKLEELFDSLPERCVVLLEDIDAVETDRWQNSDASEKKKGRLSLSGLLNTLDGIVSRDGRILFMTTNHIDQLDDALIRPGRIDKKFEIKLADSNAIVDLFKLIFRQDKCCNTQIAKGKAPDTGPDPINQLAADFAAKIPELEFSTAQIISYLLQYKHSPEDALKHAEGWVTRNSKQLISRKVEPELHPDDSEPLKDALWMKNSIKGNLVTSKLRRIGKCLDLDLIVPVSLPPSPSSSVSQPCGVSTSVPLSAVGEMAICATCVSPDADAGTELDIVVQDHCSKIDCNHNAQNWHTGIGYSLDHGARKITEDNWRELGTQGCGEEKSYYDEVLASDNGDHWPETKPQESDGVLHQAGILKKAIIVTTSIEQTTIPNTEATATTGVQTEVKAISPSSHYDNVSALPFPDLGSLNILLGTHTSDAVGMKEPEEMDFQNPCALFGLSPSGPIQQGAVGGSTEESKNASISQPSDNIGKAIINNDSQQSSENNGRGNVGESDWVQIEGEIASGPIAKQVELGYRAPIRRGDGFMHNLATARRWTIGEDGFTMSDAIDDTLCMMCDIATPLSDKELMIVYDEFKEFFNNYNKEIVKQRGEPLLQSMKIFYAWALKANLSLWSERDVVPRLRLTDYTRELINAVILSRQIGKDADHPFEKDLWLPEYEMVITEQTSTAITARLDAYAIVAGTRKVRYFPFPCSIDYWDQIIRQYESSTSNIEEYLQLVKQWIADFENQPAITARQSRTWLIAVRECGFTGDTDFLNYKVVKIDDEEGTLIAQCMAPDHNKVNKNPKMPSEPVNKPENNAPAEYTESQEASNQNSGDFNYVATKVQGYKVPEDPREAEEQT